MAECFGQRDCFFARLIVPLLILLPVLVRATDHDVARDFTVVLQLETFEDRLAEFAVNGDPESCAQTKVGGIWKLDLASPRMISSIQIKGEGRYNVYISEKEESFKLQAKDIGAVCRYGADANKAPCYSVIKGRYVTISSEPPNKALKLCDVKLFECDDQYFGRNCSLSCHCLNDELCAKDTGHCPSGCAAGYTGDDCQQECDNKTFGQNCRYRCHCLYDVTCNSVTGSCPSGCASKWIDDACQTEIPYMKVAPKLQGKTSDSITLRWPSWNNYISKDLSLHYKVQYKEWKSWNWVDTGDKVPNNVGQNYTEYHVKDLKLNSRYKFRVQPVLEGAWAKDVTIKPSPALEWTKTRCEEPEPPTDVYSVEAKPSVYKDSSSANMILYWTPPKVINCDNILYYTILYRPMAEHQSNAWERSGAHSNDTVTMLENLKFNTQYEVSIYVVNNEELSSSLAELTFKTGVGPPPPMILQSKSSDIHLIAGIIVGFIVLAAIILVFIWYRHRKRKYAAVPNKEDEEAAKLNSMVKEVDASRTDDSGLGGEGSSGSTPTAEILDPVSDKVLAVTPPGLPSRPDLLPEEPVFTEPVPRDPIPVSELEEYVTRGKENDCADLIKEYREIPEGFTAPYECGRREENKHKNRFINIIAYDNSRVILDKVEGDPDSDYINANYIDGYNQPRRYIASQGCTKYTIQDMWRMVWQVGSHRIVMVTNLVENGKRKCEQYWQDHENVEKFYGDVGVTLLEQEHTKDFTIRTFNIRKGNENRNVKQFHFTAWPDHGVPTRPSPIIHFRRKVRSYDESHPGVITVHCSAGVGRTGTFIALDYLLDKAEAENVVDVYNLTLRMRQNRVNMIQTVEQYIFVYDALLEALTSGNTAIPCCSFKEEYNKLLEINPQTNKSLLQEQFETLQAASQKSKTDDTSSGQLPENEGKNRRPDVLPADRYRPYLMTRVQGTNDYINAIFLDGYKSKNAYILTQMPLPHTVIDMWRMIHEHKCGSIVMLNPFDEDDPTYGQYWPGENQECECGPYVVESCSVDTSNPNIVVRELKLQYTPDSPKLGSSSEVEVRKVNHFQLTCWPNGKMVPDEPNSLIALIELLVKSQLKTGNGPIVIHCHDGVLRSGLFAAVCCIWERMKVEQDVDIFHAVKYLRFHRPQVIQDLEQYKFCYEMVLAYLAEFEIYANFR